MTLGQRLRHVRKSRGMTQEEAAYWCEVTRSQIANLESKRFDPRVATLRKMADAYGTTVSELLGETPMRLDGLTRKERAVIELMRREYGE